MSRIIDIRRMASTFPATSWLLVLLVSCTIIKDNDVTSQKKLDSLRLKSVEIAQVTDSGSSTIVAVVTSDSVVNISIPNGKINRKVWMDWPAFGNYKLKLKSGVTTAFKTYTSYLESGKPYTFHIFRNDTLIVESYRFRYDANGRLNKILSFTKSCCDTPTSNDTVIYDRGKLASIIRRSDDPSKAGTFLFTFQNSNPLDQLIKFTFQGMEYGNPCQNCGPSWGGNYYVVPGTTGFPAGVMNLTSFQREYLSIQDRNNNLQGCSGSGCIRWIDTFYFHPLMMLKDQFEFGDELLFIYMVDWWQPISTKESPNDEKVTFSFKYDL